jgi:hypothetical protein
MFDQSQLLHISLTRSKLILQFFALTTALNLGWEILQLPLYTLWGESTFSAIGFAVVHCTVGDVLIASLSLTVALILVGSRNWPRVGYLTVAIVAGTLGIAYTVFSEWNNTVVTRAWSYSSLMPTVWGIGLSPLAQWFIVPGFVFWCFKPNSTCTPVRPERNA